MGSPKAMPPKSMWLSRTVRRVALVSMVSALLPLTMLAQLTVGHVTGTITDTSGSVIPGRRCHIDQ